MNTWIFAVCFGSALFIGGLLMMRGHWLAWRTEKNDTDLDDDDRTFYYRRYRRRMQTSAIISLIGLMIAVGDAVLPKLFANHQQQMLVFGVYWGTVLLLTGYVIIMALADMLAASAHARIALSRVRFKQRELEKQLDEIRRRGSNGHHHSN